MKTEGMNDMNQMAAQRKLQRMSRYGSHRVKVEVRRNGSMSPVEALKTVRASLVGGGMVAHDIRRAASLQAKKNAG